MRVSSIVLAVAAATVSTVQAETLPATYAEVSKEQQPGESNNEWTIPAFPGLQVYFRPRSLKLYEGATLSVADCADLENPKRVFDYNDALTYVVSNTGCLHVKLTTEPAATTMSYVKFMYHSRSRNYKQEDMPCTLAGSGEKNCNWLSKKRMAAGLPACHYYTETRYRSYRKAQVKIGCEAADYCHFDNPTYCDARNYCERVGGLCFNAPAPQVDVVAECYKPGRPAEECDPDYCDYYEFLLPNLNTGGKTSHKVSYGCLSKDFCDFTKVPHSYSAVPLEAQKYQCDMHEHCHWDAGVDACLLITEMPTTSPTVSPTNSPTKYPTVSPTSYPTQSPVVDDGGVITPEEPTR